MEREVETLLRLRAHILKSIEEIGQSNHVSPTFN